MKSKNCIDCKTEKEVRFFSKRSNKHSTKTVYRMSACKVCMVARTKKWVANNKERLNEYQKNYSALRRQQNESSQDETTSRHE